MKEPCRKRRESVPREWAVFDASRKRDSEVDVKVNFQLAGIIRDSTKTHTDRRITDEYEGRK